MVVKLKHVGAILVYS